MKHLTTYTLSKRVSKDTKIFELSENEDNDIFDICQELIDIGWQVIIGEKQTGIVVRNFKHPLRWSEIRDYALRLKDYLGDKFKSINVTVIPRISDTNYSVYTEIKLSENTEIFYSKQAEGFIQVFRINLNEDISESKKKPRKLKRYKEFVKRKPITNRPYQWVPISNKNSPEPLLNNIPMASTVE